MIGRRFGHYVVIELLGSGGMGVVYRARDEHLHRDVVLKVLRSDILADEEAQTRFRREALALSRLSHPNIGTVFDFDVQDGVHYLAMELVEGESLDREIARGPLTEDRAVRIASQIAEALAVAHERGVVHRDLKPANVVVTPRGVAKVLDFGLAKLARLEPAMTGATTMTEAGTSMGTLPYMSPEQLLGHAVDGRTDLYALGVTLYEMVTGRRPFGGDTSFALANQILNEPVPPPTKHRAGLSPRVETVILRCLSRRLEDRYASAAEVLADLAGGAPAKAPTRRRPRLAPAIAAGVIVLGVLGITAALKLARPGGGTPRALAVLPLENLSRDPEQEYFAEGMTDELITGLAQVGSLKVISRSSMTPYRGTHKTPGQIAKELGVDALVEGTVVQSGGRVRVTAQLVRAENGVSLWADQYDRDLRDVLTIQNDVARAIVEKIRLKLQPEERVRLTTARKVDPEAYQNYLKGRYAWSRYTADGFLEAQRLYQHAIEIDPTWAPAYAGLANAAYGLSSLYLAPVVAIPRARAAAERALSLDPSLASAHTALGITHLVFDWDMPGALAEFDRAISLNPNDADAHLWRASELICLSRFDEGLRETRRAQELDPLNPWINAKLGWHLYFARRYDEAASHLRDAIRLDPDYFIPHILLGLTLEQQGDHRGAVAELETAVSRDSNPDDLCQLAHAYGTAGRRRDALRVIQIVLDRRATSFVPAADLALAYAGLGDREQFFAWIDRALVDRSEFLTMMKVEPALDPMRSDPRFKAALRRIGFEKNVPPAQVSVLVGRHD